MANSTSAPSRHRIACRTFAAGLVLALSACKDPRITSSLGAPEVSMGGQTGDATATIPNPCEIDINFGSVPIGLTDSVTVVIKNVGSSALDLSQVNPTLDPEFGLNYGPQAPIASGSVGELSVTFQPYKVGQVQSTFTIQTDGLNAQCPAPSGGGSIVRS